MFFSGIDKYLNGHVLCVQFFDFRFRLDFSWGLLFVTFSLNTGPKKSLNENENQKTVNTIHDHQDTCEFQKKTFSEKCTILAKSCFKNHQKLGPKKSQNSGMTFLVFLNIFCSITIYQLNFFCGYIRVFFSPIDF